LQQFAAPPHSRTIRVRLFERKKARLRGLARGSATQGCGQILQPSLMHLYFSHK
jgi:hypothetical protein